jgi:dihydropteroate synthase|tara:strand:+ start:505 stop:1362 length:858 start_codon:yes stop_codon:yes gene_type:complete
MSIKVLTKSENKMLINCRGNLIDLSSPKVMGIVNLTPDSFYAESRKTELVSILKKVEEMLIEGTDFIDLGAYSSRPNSIDISLEEELNRSETISSIAKEFPHAILSIDTFRSEVAIKAIEHGACIINDISGGELDPNMFETVAKLQVPYIMMHMKGNPQTMKNETDYVDLLNDINRYFSSKINQLKQLGVNDIIIDPGIGFAKNANQNFKILQHLQQFQIFGLPLLIGLSRKSFISKTLNIDTSETLNGTTVLNSLALINGAKILRVHDVKEAKQAVRLFEAFLD